MTYYEVLGVKKTATQKEIKEAYKKLVKKYHPDIYQGDKLFAEKKTKSLNLAYDILSDPVKKAAYDEEISPTPVYQYSAPKYTSKTRYYTRNSYSNNYDENINTSSTYKKFHEMHNKFTDNILKQVSSLKLIQKILLFLAIMAIYLILLLLTFSQYDKMSSDEYTGTLLGPVKKENTSVQTDEYKNSSYYNNRKEFHIEDIMSDKELYEYYKNSEYKNNYTFEEYKEIMENYMYQLWYDHN